MLACSCGFIDMYLDFLDYCCGSVVLTIRFGYGSVGVILDAGGFICYMA